MRRAVLVVVCLALALALTGCGGLRSAGPTSPLAAEGFPADVPQELKVNTPKDARGVAQCDLLTPAQLTTLGLDPTTARPDVRGLDASCMWYYADRSTYASLGISTNPNNGKLPGFWRLFHNDPAFETFEVAGHPALRADQEPDRSCSLGVGVADLQYLVVDAYFDRKPRPDPCAPARRMAEMVLSNLPPLR